MVHYLYGDSTPSPLTSNVLEFLRDALDFSAFVLHADDRMKLGQAKAQANDVEADAELNRLDHFIDVVANAISTAEKGAEKSPTANCGTRIAELVRESHRASISAIRNDVGAARARIEAEEAAVRNEALQALATLLSPHDPPDGVSVTQMALGADGAYQASREGTSVAFNLVWALDLAIPESWAQPVKVERFAPHLEIAAPQRTGWLTKESKVKPLRLEQHVITGVTLERNRTSVRIRSEIPTDTGFDMTISEGAVSIARTGPSDDPSVGGFDPRPEDAGPLADLGEKVRTALVFKNGSPRRAMVGEQEFRAMPLFLPFVEKAVEILTPIVREISNHSLSPTELVIRRLLANDRREEFFVATSTLVEKYAKLPEEQRALFAPLKLGERTIDAPAPLAPPPVRTPTIRPVAPKAATPAAAPAASKPAAMLSKPPASPMMSKPPVPPAPARPVALSDSDFTEEDPTATKSK